MEAPRKIGVITLGTAGGPRYWQGTERFGISTAIIVDDGFYLVDCGHGVGRQLMRAGLDVGRLKGIFITHLHSDHTVDLDGLILFGLSALQHRRGNPIPISGPGDRGALPLASPRASKPPMPMHIESPTPGTEKMFHTLMAAHATDLNDRIIDSLRPNPVELFEPRDIAIPSDVEYDPHKNPTPDMEPFEIFRDDSVVVTATLVRHPPMAPAFGFRFQTSDGSVVISGDTAYTDNIVRLAANAGLLLHEALDFDYMEHRYGTKSDEMSKASLEHHYKSHSSVHDAIRVAEQAGVNRLALHHLVPGNMDTSHWEKIGQSFNGEFAIPDDLDTLSCEQLCEAKESPDIGAL